MNTRRQVLLGTILAAATFIFAGLPLQTANAAPEPKNVNIQLTVVLSNGGSPETWKKSTPPGQWTFSVSETGGGSPKTTTDGNSLSVAPSDYLISLASGASGAVYDFILSSAGNSDCTGTPVGGPSTLTIRQSDFEGNATRHACVFIRETAAAAAATASPTSAAASVPTATPTASATPVATTTGSPTATASPSAVATNAVGATGAASPVSPSEGKLKVTVQIWDGTKKGKWGPSSPGGKWLFTLKDSSGNVVKTFTDAEDQVLPTASYTISFQGSVSGTSTATIVDFVLSANGNSQCQEPSGTNTVLSLSASDLVVNGTRHSCAFINAGASNTSTGPKVKLTNSFVSAGETTVKWKVEPSDVRDVTVWNPAAVECEAFNGASCGNIGKGGSGTFSASGPGQYLLITQPYELKDEQCEVTNVAEWIEGDATTRESVSGTYQCSGASTMGWGLFALFAAGAIGLAAMVRKKSRS